jgi:hypothetical protein
VPLTTNRAALVGLRRGHAELALTDINPRVGQSEASNSLGDDGGFERLINVVLMEGPLAIQWICLDEEPAGERTAYAEAIGAEIPTIGLLSATPPRDPANGALNEKMPPSEATNQ